MSEIRPVYIRCASGSNSHTDCVIRPHGDCVEILGHPLMHVAPNDAAHFATAMLHAADSLGYQGDDEMTAQLRSEIAKTLHCPAIVDAAIRDLLQRCSEALAYQEREANYWRREWQASEEMYWAESSDGK
jgi:hypothetical protein